MISEEAIKKINELKQQGVSNKAIAKVLNIDVKTVRKYLNFTDIPHNLDTIASSELIKTKQRTAEIKARTELLKAETEHKKQEILSDLEEMELALQEDAKEQKEKDVFFKYGMLYLNQLLEEPETPFPTYPDNFIEEIKNYVSNSLKQFLLDGSFEDKEGLEEWIGFELDTIEDIISKRELKIIYERESQKIRGFPPLFPREIP